MADFNYSSFIWGIADKLRGPYRRADYGKVILPFIVLRRLDCVLEATKADVLAVAATTTLEGPARDFQLNKASGYSFYNTSPFDMAKAAGDPANLRANLVSYVEGFSENIRDVFERYEFASHLARLAENDLLLLILQEFVKIDLHPNVVSNTQMGHIFEDLIARSMEASNEEAGEYFTPRDAVRLVVALLFANDGEVLGKQNVVRSVYDPTAGTGGMLSVAEDYVHRLNPGARLNLFGQELNAASYAIAKTDLLIKGQQADNMVLGDTLTDDGHAGKTFDYGLANPPFGVEWKKQQDYVIAEHTNRGFAGRFGPGLPRVNDGALLFLLHLVSKMQPVSQGGGRVGIVLNGSPLFTGNAGSGESEIRRYLLEHDLVEAIVALPTDMFYNTGIATYVWILDNDKAPERRGTVQLIDGTQFFQKLKKNLGNKRKELANSDIDAIVRLYDGFEPGEHSKIFTTTDFGYTTITVERPLRLNWAISPERVEAVFDEKSVAKLSGLERDALRTTLLSEAHANPNATTDATAFTARVKRVLEHVGITASATLVKNIVQALSESDPSAPVVTDAKGKPQPDTSLRDTENVPLSRDIDDYITTEISPHVSDFWVDRTKDKVGYEIPFTRHFYSYVPPRQLEEIDTDLNNLVAEIQELLREVER